MIYDTKTWEYPYLYNLINQYRSLENTTTDIPTT